MLKNKYELEYIVNVSPKILFNRISTPSGLAEWFADDVNIRSDVYTFFWDGSEQDARLISKRDAKSMKFRWLDEEDEEAYFEFKIEIEELTGGVALIITDFAEEDEEDSAIELWDSQIDKLKHVLGS